MKETEDNTNKWKSILGSQIEGTNFEKMSTLLKALDRFNAIPIKVSMAFFTELEKINKKFEWKHE